MAITFSLAPNPHWVVIDNFSKLPPGAVIYTFSSLNPSVPKTAFADAGGTEPYGAFIQGLGNGTFPPIFWQFDSNNPMDLYDIEVWTGIQGVDSTATLLWEFSGLTGTTSGGGGTITTNLDLDNLVINGQFFRNVGNLPISPPGSLPNSIILAPSNHDGFVGVENSAGNDGPPSPDIIFAKNIGNEIDSISFINFNQGDNFFGSTPTPQQFVEYVSNNMGTANYKYIQFPLVKGLQNLNNQNISVQMWNKLNSGSINIKLSLRQFFGNGGAPHADVITDLTALNLSSGNWLQTKVISQLVPSIAGLTLGTCGNDALFLQLRFPTSEAVDLSFILPAVYIGSATSQVDFHTLDYVDSIANSPRTGDIRMSLNSFSPYGWVVMNDGTIGDASSNSTTRANIDTFPLFDLIWSSFQANQTLAPMFTSAGTPAAYGASSIADFTAHNRLSLTKAAGRVIAGVGSGSGLTSRTIGQTTGAEVITIASMPQHNHPGSTVLSGVGAGTTGFAEALNIGGTTHAVTIAPQGGGTLNVQGAADGDMQPTVFMNVFIKL